MNTDSPIWHALIQHHALIANADMRVWFEAKNEGTPTRAERFSLQVNGLFLDYAKNRIDDHALALLIQLARECQVEQQRNLLWQGAIVNQSEQRAAWHMAIRNLNHPDIAQQQFVPLKQSMEALLTFYHDRQKRQQQIGKPLRHLIYLGIGGSELGPRFVCRALQYTEPTEKLALHFISSLDSAELAQLIHSIDLDETLICVCSKTFHTLETLENTRLVSEILQQKGIKQPQQQLIAITHNRQAALDFGILPHSILNMEHAIYGRFSLWSAVGLPILFLLGIEKFMQLFSGAQRMDQHFLKTPLEKNMPVILALLSVWYRNFFQIDRQCIVPYCEALSDFPDYIQQLTMESNGKSLNNNGQIVSQHTAPILFGTTGNQAQHSYFQHLHQGSIWTPIDFIAVLRPLASEIQHKMILAQCFAQSEALLNGYRSPDLQTAYRNCPGNRPSNTLLLDALTPDNLGALIALYEHKTFVESVIWNINPFDQWGVELGKSLGKTIYAEFSDMQNHIHDSSTQSLIKRAQNIFKK